MSSQKTIRQSSRTLSNARLYAAYATLSDRPAAPAVRSSKDLLRDLEKNTVEIVVTARSSNTNSFGLREHILVLRDGQTFRALRSAYSPDAEVWQVGARLQVVVSCPVPESQPLYLRVCGALIRQGFECVSVVPVSPGPEEPSGRLTVLKRRGLLFCLTHKLTRAEAGYQCYVRNSANERAAVAKEIRETWNAARDAGGQLEAFRILERMTDRLGYGRTQNNPPLLPNAD